MVAKLTGLKALHFVLPRTNSMLWVRASRNYVYIENSSHTNGQLVSSHFVVSSLVDLQLNHASIARSTDIAHLEVLLAPKQYAIPVCLNTVLSNSG